MGTIIRYRSGMDRRTGRLLQGKAHLAQSLAFIWMTRRDSVIMALNLGSNLRSVLAEDIEPGIALLLYDELITSAHEVEPEYRIDNLQFVSLSRDGGLGIRHDGTYYPEGRFGNYAIAEPFGQTAPFIARETITRATAISGAAP
ncbi:integrase [Notoacmeibacter ruber]|uniref:Integrase n=1 Tax=Notoacmeibacter ruber TaxID=2670375 RepID=A0A3L7JE06_9HYPH|nr:integrase [Notoacmeibacter ruber]RLQ88916.1 integrase [Notoacmeibacter ruber]